MNQQNKNKKNLPHLNASALDTSHAHWAPQTIIKGIVEEVLLPGGSSQSVVLITVNHSGDMFSKVNTATCWIEAAVQF